MRIDEHVHGDSGEIKGALQTVAAESSAAGIERVGYIGEADDVLRASRESPDFIIPIAQFDMDQVKAQETHDAIDEGAVGIKFIDPQFSYGDTRYDPLYAAISDRKRVDVFHTGYLNRGRLDQPVHTDMALMRPAAVDCLSRRHPDLTIIMAHYGNPWWEEAWKVALSGPNTYADLCGGTAIDRSLPFRRETFDPNGCLQELCIDKLMFATDMDMSRSDYVDGCRPYFEFYDNLFDAIGATESQREQVNRGTAFGLFGLD